MFYPCSHECIHIHVRLCIYTVMYTCIHECRYIFLLSCMHGACKHPMFLLAESMAASPDTLKCQYAYALSDYGLYLHVSHMTVQFF